MQINHIHVENYKTYLMLDLDVSVKDEERPIILIGGMNGSGKTTLFDAIYGALYGLEIRDERHFRELFNSGVTDIIGKRIVLEIDFEGMIGSKTAQYKLTRTYQIVNAKAVENVTLHIGGTTYTYGTRTAQKDRTINEEAVKKIIKANLPKELSNYFLFDAMKTSELVKDEQINQLIRDNIKSVMGFNKYSLLVNVSSKMLDEMKAGRIENENLKKEFQELQEHKRNIEGELSSLRNSYDDALGYANNNREQYNSSFGSKNSVLYAVWASWLSNAIRRLSAMTCLSTVSSSHSSISATMHTTSSIASQMQSMTVISLNPRYVSLNRPPIVS